MKSVVDENGRIQLPDEVPVRVGVKPGDEVIFEARGCAWVLKSTNAKTGLAWEGDILVHNGTMLTDKTIEDLIDESRDERFHHLTDGSSP